MTLPKMLWVPYSLRFVQRVRRFAEQVARPERLELPTLCFEEAQYKILSAASGVAYERTRRLSRS